MNQYTYITKSVEETMELGIRWGVYLRHSKTPFCIALDGTLGAGKTHFSQGIAKGFGVVEEVTSPTFALMNTYAVEDDTLYHFDLYRLDEVEELETIGFYEYTEEKKCIIEWASKFEDELPHEIVSFHIAIGEEGERIWSVTTEILSLELLQSLGDKAV